MTLDWDIRPACSHCGLPVMRPARAPRADPSNFGGDIAAARDDGPLFCCYGCYLVSRIVGPRNQPGAHAWNILRLAAGAFLAMNVMMLSVLLYTGAVEQQAAGVFRWVLLGLAAPAMAILVYPFAAGAAGEIARRRLSMDTLIAAGSLAAFIASAAATITGRGNIYYDTATMLPLLVTFGKIIEAGAKGRAGDLLRELETLLPDRAERIGPDGLHEMAVGELRAGDRVLVRPGGRFPADGVVIEGTSTVLEAAFTGEPGPRLCHTGDRVLAGTVNQDGSLVVESRQVGTGVLLGRIIEMVREARQRTAPFERAAQRAAAVFTPATLALAAAAGVWWLVFRGAAEGGMAALAVIVVACPCAMGIATPLAVALAIGRAAKEGIVVRGGDAMERAGRVGTVFFDKTGTLTAGAPALVAVESHDPSVGEDELLGWLAGAESRSEHALARAAVAAAKGRGIEVGMAGALHAFPGRGVRADVSLGGVSRVVLAGSEEFVRDGMKAGSSVGSSTGEREEEVKEKLIEDAREEDAGKMPAIHMGKMPMLRKGGTPSPRAEGTDVWVAWEGRVRGRAVFADVVRPGAAEVVAQLHRMDIRCVLLSGDRREAAEAVAEGIGIDCVEAPCLPQEKLARVREAAAAEAAAGTGDVAAMVGDGINDGPALAEAALGIALGAGTDLARQAGNVVLLSDRLDQVPWLIALGRRTRRVVRQNLAWAFGYNAIALAAAATGLLHPLLAAVAMVVSSLTVLANSLRLRSFP